MVLDPRQAIRVLDALAQEHRLAIVRLLAARRDAGLAAGAIAAALGVPGSSLSFHLGQLRIAGLIRQERRSRSLIYAAEPATIDALVCYLLERCLPAEYAAVE